jgi:acetyl-CoA carboxylase carboxyltransferase component
MGKWMNGYLEKLAANREENIAAGGKDRIKLQHKLGKLTARERIELLADPGSFEEIGSVVAESVRRGRDGADQCKWQTGDGIRSRLYRYVGFDR